MMELKVKQWVTYGGHSLLANGGVKLTLVAQYSELPNTIQLTPMLNEDVELIVKLTQDSKAVKLGSFRIKQIIIDGDGESKIKFDSQQDFVEVDNLNLLPLKNDDLPEFNVLYRCRAQDVGSGDDD